MKNKLLILIITLIIGLPAYCSSVEKKDLTTYFKSQTKNVQKVWQKESIIKSTKYKTSYARVFFKLGNNGEILSYKIKSSCIPKDDTEFLQAVERTVSTIKFNKIPTSYKNKDFNFTIKFNSYLSDYKRKNIDWHSYGIANIEVGESNSYFILKEDE